MRLKKLIRDYLSFSKSEVNGVLVLIPLITFFILSPYFYRQIFGINYSTYEEDKRLLDSLNVLIDQAFSEPESDILPYYFKFNPNTASVNELNTLGIPSFLSARINNYRKKGGKFKVKGDLLKIFDFPDTLYRQLEEYIELPTVLNPVKVPSTPKSSREVRAESATVIEESSLAKKTVFVLDLNEADTAALKRIKGIGSSYAKRIVGYRNLLGGFHSMNQLEEVYGMTYTLYHRITPFLKIADPSIVKQVSINLATFKELLAHPYIGYEQTKEILNVKSRNGKFKKPEDLYRLTLMDSIAIAKLIPYIKY